MAFLPRYWLAAQAVPVAKRTRFSEAKRVVSIFIAISRRISARENWWIVSLVIPNMAAPFFRFSCSAQVCHNFRRKGEGKQVAISKGIEGETFSSLHRAPPSCLLLIAQHFADDEAWESTWRALPVSALRMAL